MNASLKKLDPIDMKILVQLQRSGRMSNLDLADAIGLTPTPCLLRVRRLERAGYITGYNALINLAKLGNAVTVFAEVTLAARERESCAEFEEAASHFEEITECHLVSGGGDYLLKFVTRSLAHYQEIIDTLVEGHAGIGRYSSHIVIKTPIRRVDPPIHTFFRM